MCRDIKAENILLESSGSLNVKVADFGFACFYKEASKDILGSPLYMAPEIVSGGDYGEKVDVWSTGVIAYILVTGKPPFKGRDRDDIFASIKFLDLSLDGLDHLSKECRSFLILALTKEPQIRPSASALL